MITFYFAKQTRAVIVRWMLEELEVPYEAIELDFKKLDHKKEEYLQIHPLGKVPAIKDGDTAIFETSAICLYLADKFPEKGLCPPSHSKERGLYYQWVSFAVATIEPLITQFVLNSRLPEEMRQSDSFKSTTKLMQDSLLVIERALSQSNYLLGNSFTTADLLLGSMLEWMTLMRLFPLSEPLVKYLDTLKTRPAYQRSR